MKKTDGSRTLTHLHYATLYTRTDTHSRRHPSHQHHPAKGTKISQPRFFLVDNSMGSESTKKCTNDGTGAPEILSFARLFTPALNKTRRNSRGHFSR